MEELHCGDLSIGLAPEIGGSVAFFRKGGTDVMRPLSDDDRAAGNVLGVAMFPMVPYANRIAGNLFSFEGRTYAFSMNNPPERYNVHGTGWHLPWTAQRLGDDTIVLRLEHVAPEEPYSYRAEQRFTLSPEALAVVTAVENRGDRRMPFGFGQHPWFPPDPDALITFEAGTVWLIDEDGVPTERLAPPPDRDFRRPRTVPDDGLMNCFGDWARWATIEWPGRGLGLRIEADPIFRHLMVYADPKRPALCLEPQTNAVSAFTMSADDLGVIELNPGESASGTIRFMPFAR